MDPAIIGSCRIGHFRIGVFRDDWDRLLTRLKNLSLKQVGTDPPVLGWSRHGYTYHGVQYGLFQDLKKKVENA